MRASRSCGPSLTYASRRSSAARRASISSDPNTSSAASAARGPGAEELGVRRGALGARVEYRAGDKVEDGETHRASSAGGVGAIRGGQLDGVQIEARELARRTAQPPAVVGDGDGQDAADGYRGEVGLVDPGGCHGAAGDAGQRREGDGVGLCSAGQCQRGRGGQQCVAKFHEVPLCVRDVWTVRMRGLQQLQRAWHPG